MRFFFLIIICLISFESFGQKPDSTRIHIAGAYSFGLNGFLKNNPYNNAFYNAFYSQASIGFRKELFKKSDFIGLFLTYTDRALRSFVYNGNPFFPEETGYHNHYLALKAEGGIYIYKSWYLKESLSMEYLVKSDYYSDADFNSFRGVKKLNISFETSIGKDVLLFNKSVIHLDLMAGITFIRPMFLYAGPKIGFYFKDPELINSHSKGN